MWLDRRYQAALLLILTVPALGAGKRIVLRETGAAPEVQIRLSDIADIEAATPSEQSNLSSITLGYAPTGDAERILNRQNILRVLERSGISTAEWVIEGAEEVRIRSAWITLEPDEVARAIRQQLQLDHPGGQLILHQLKVTWGGRILVPPGRFTLVPNLNSASESSSTPIAVDVLADQRKLRHFYVQVEWDWEADVAVTTARLGYGKILSEADFRWTRLRRQDNPASLLLRSRAADSLRVRRPIPEGKALALADLAPPRWVERGDLVQLLVRGQGFNIITTATAQQSGESGEKIRVLQPNSKKVQFGKVIGKNKVEIVL